MIVRMTESETLNEAIQRAGIIETGTYAERNQVLTYNGESMPKPGPGKWNLAIWARFGVLIVPHGEKIYRASFKGRLCGALGITYRIATHICGSSAEQAKINLYHKYEHISGLTITAKS